MLPVEVGLLLTLTLVPSLPGPGPGFRETSPGPVGLYGVQRVGPSGGRGRLCLSTATESNSQRVSLSSEHHHQLLDAAVSIRTKGPQEPQAGERRHRNWF